MYTVNCQLCVCVFVLCVFCLVYFPLWSECVSVYVIDVTLRSGYLCACNHIVYSTHEKRRRERERGESDERVTFKNNTRLPFVDISSVSVVWIQSEKSKKNIYKAYVHKCIHNHTLAAGRRSKKRDMHAYKLGCIVRNKTKKTKKIIFFRILSYVGWAKSVQRCHHRKDVNQQNHFLRLVFSLGDTPYFYYYKL